eukprot:351993-Chlamydomonas_euryale.AAC.1
MRAGSLGRTTNKSHTHAGTRFCCFPPLAQQRPGQPARTQLTAFAPHVGIAALCTPPANTQLQRLPSPWARGPGRPAPRAI